MTKLSPFLFLLVILLQQPLFSQENVIEKHPILTSKLQLGIGYFIPSQTIRIGVNGSSENTEIEFNDALKLSDNNSAPQFNFDWRFTKKWKVSLEYFNMNKSSAAILDKDIQWNDYTLKAGSSVTGGIDIDLYRIYIGGALSQGLHHEFGLGLGIHGLDINPYIQGKIYLNDELQELERVSVSAFAPLPNIAIWYYYALNPKWAFMARLDWFGIKIDPYTGSLWDFTPSVRYQIIKNLAISADYRYFKVSAGVDQNNWDGSFYMVFQGPTFTLTGNL